MKNSQDKTRPSGVRLIKIDRRSSVWTKRVGHGGVKMLTLHGGPGLTHEYLECFEKFLPKKEVEFYYYDQLGSGFSDQPKDESLWTLNRFRDEVEQVRMGLGLDGFYLYGHSWGGILGIEYALKYQCHLKALIISNMTASEASYEKHLNRLRRKFPLEARRILEKYEDLGDYDASEYQDTMHRFFYSKYMCRLDPWPEPLTRSIQHTNDEVFNTLHGPNEFVATSRAKDWDRWKQLRHIVVPTLLLVGRYDTVSVQDVQKMSKLIPNCRVGICRNGSHLSMYDDQRAYFSILLDFIRKVENDKLNGKESAR